jgi:hypothetical protein
MSDPFTPPARLISPTARFTAERMSVPKLLNGPVRSISSPTRTWSELLEPPLLHAASAAATTTTASAARIRPMPHRIS